MVEVVGLLPAVVNETPGPLAVDAILVSFMVTARIGENESVLKKACVDAVFGI